MSDKNLAIGRWTVMSPARGRELLEALGLSGRRVLRLSLHFEAGSVSQLEITEHVSDDQADGLVQVLRRFDLLERDVPTAAAAGPASAVDLSPPPSHGPGPAD